MKAKDLLIPRFEVINNYPDCDKHKLAIGSIVTFEYYTDETKQWYNDNGQLKIYDAYYEGYPHLFRKLNWWEKRTKEQMPKKLKSLCSKDEPNFDIEKEEVFEILDWDMNGMMGFLNIEKSQVCDLEIFTPEYGYIPVD